MALEEYRRKRDFRRTPEPSGDPGGDRPARPQQPALATAWARLPAGRRFCVQMHHASRLHWDLRLELGGVLLSWAVPKGPTLDPGERRLAVHVEDHPLDYGDFEGVIPSGYGAGTVMLWDAGIVTWQRESAADPRRSLEHGDLKFALEGVKLRGEFALVHSGSRGRRGAAAAERQWLLIKKRDEAAVPGFDAADHDVSVLTGRSLAEIAAGASTTAPPVEDVVSAAPTRRVPSSIVPMLAVAAAAPFTRAGWLFELKYDGVRVVATVHAGSVQLRSRRGRDESRRYPELAELHAALGGRDAVVDGEVVSLDGQGGTSFERLQRRINIGDLRQVARLRDEVPATLMVFDLLAVDGHDLRDLPLAERKHVLRGLLSDTEHVRFADHVETDGEALFAAARSRGLEGIVAKDAQSRYEAGRRSGAWVKVRTWRTQDCAIGGFTAGRGGRGDLGALVLGVCDAGRLVHCGRVGSGIDADAQGDLLARLRRLVIDECPFTAVPPTDTAVTWVRPEVVCSVRFIGWTAAGTLRQPTYRGIREDLAVSDAVREPEPEPAPSTPPARTRAVAPPQPAAAGAPSPAATAVAARRARPRAQPHAPATSSRAAAAVASATAVAPSHADALAALRAMDAQGTWEIGGRRLHLTNLDKPLWPDQGITKRDLIAYYVGVAPVLLPHLHDRAVGMQVFPDGIDGKHFWRKRIPDHAPDWIPTWTYRGDSTVTYVLVEEVATLAWMANGAVIDIHPWHSRVDAPTLPDWAVFDLDPFPPATFDDVRTIARMVHAALDHYGLRGWPKTSGQTGLQIYVPLERGPDQDAVRAFVEEVARAIGRVARDLVSFEWAVARRSGRLRIDYTQNVIGKTLAAPYSVRPAPRAPVSVPVTWEELDDPALGPDRWTIHTVGERLARVGDLFGPVLGGGQLLPAP